MKFYNLKHCLRLCLIIPILYASAILNTNIEQEVHDMPIIHTPQEMKFLGYLQIINKSAIGNILSQYSSSAPVE